VSSETDDSGDTRRARNELLGALAIVAGTAALALGPGLAARFSPHPSKAECEALLTRYVELKERAVSEKMNRKSYAAALDSARRTTGPAFAGCTSEVTMDEAACTRRANNADEFERCLR